MATAEENLARFQEISDRGLQDKLPLEIRARFDEAVSRGLVTQAQKAQEQDELISGLEDAGAINNSGGVFEAVAEPLTQMAGGISGLAVGGLEMMARTPFQGLDKAVEEGKKTIQSFNEASAPRTEVGRQSSELLGEGMQQLQKIPAGWAGIADLLTSWNPESAAQTVKKVEEFGLPDVAADKVFEETGSPILATMTKASPELATLLFTRGRFARDAKVKKAERDFELIERIKSGSPDADLAEYRLTNRDKWSEPTKIETEILAEKLHSDPELAEAFANSIPKLEKSKAYSPAVKQEWDQGALSLVKTASRPDLDVMERMLDIYESGAKNPMSVIGTRPLFESGKPIERRIKFLLNKKRDAGKRVERAAKDLKGEKVPFEPVVDGFIEKLKDEGIVFNGGNPITDASQYKNIDFRNSLFEASEQSQAVIKDSIEWISRQNANDAFVLHNLKKKLPVRVATAKRSEGGLEPKAEILLNDLRRDVNSTLRDHSKEYELANDSFAEAIGPLNKFNDAMPPNSRITWEGVNPDKAGLQTRKILSNYANGPDIYEAIKDIDLVSKRLGAKYDDDAVRQALFAINLDKRLGAFADQTFQGLQESAQKNVIGSIPVSQTDAALKGIGGIIRKVKRVDNERAIKAMREYLKETKGGQ
ncbi:MAG: hypothetical protein GY920_03800 [Aliivibrio sp.]|nr:hypothetical protein [Aliivibrio sp.]